ncbi:hypothetical protein RRG08_062670 [Elysia crispata]|uniref:Uncharacterized protein n=1 Tax=Elysia crispata TaxID=231223 RepID=A0AAE1AAA5_9GAST|nr:hypothetical protein RRG08_062670 [Elysia crispata]
MQDKKSWLPRANRIIPSGSFWSRVWGEKSNAQLSNNLGTNLVLYHLVCENRTLQQPEDKYGSLSPGPSNNLGINLVLYHLVCENRTLQQLRTGLSNQSGSLSPEPILFSITWYVRTGLSNNLGTNLVLYHLVCENRTLQQPEDKDGSLSPGPSNNLRTNLVLYHLVCENRTLQQPENQSGSLSPGLSNNLTTNLVLYHLVCGRTGLYNNFRTNLVLYHLVCENRTLQQPENHSGSLSPGLSNNLRTTLVLYHLVCENRILQHPENHSSSLSPGMREQDSPTTWQPIWFSITWYVRTGLSNTLRTTLVLCHLVCENRTLQKPRNQSGSLSPGV